MKRWIRMPVVAALAMAAGWGPSTGEVPRIRVLDGDTLVVNGAVVRLAGIDAPELGPWARCWAEAALAGHAKAFVESALVDAPAQGRWRLSDSGAGGAAAPRARLIRDDGQELAELLVVGGYAARTDGRWDWCGADADLHSPDQDEPAPYGPNLWWPTGPMFDARAAD